MMSRTDQLPDRRPTPRKKTPERLDPAPTLPSRPRERAAANAAPVGTDRDQRITTSAEAIEVSSTVQIVPLKRLVVSEQNVRHDHEADEEIPTLADKIHSDGLLQNLVVVPELGDMLGVVAGRRRLLCLWRNRDLGRIDDDFPVPVLVKPFADGRAISLAENVDRLPMNPADEFVAYAQIVRDYAGDMDAIDYCARRYHKTRTYIEQRLRLANLAPDILEALRSDHISQSAANAYAGVDVPALQLQVFHVEEHRELGAKHEPRNIRSALRALTVPSTFKTAIYVGVEAYREAGGRVDRDLFMGADEGELLLDPAILEDLAREKAQTDATTLATRDGFAEGKLAVGFTTMPIWPRMPAGFVASPPSLTLDDLPRDRRDGGIGLYYLANDGTGLRCGGWWLPFTPRIQTAPPAPSSPAPGARAPEMPAAIAQVDSSAAVDRAEKQRAAWMRLKAAQLAVADIAGDTLTGIAFFPGADATWVPVLQDLEDGSGDLLVTVQIRVDRAAFDAAMPEAEQQLKDRSHA